MASRTLTHMQVDDGCLRLAVAQTLRRWRTAHALTQEELARRAGCSQAALSTLEAALNGPSLNMLFALAAAFQVPPTTLLKEIQREYQAQQRREP